MSDDGRIAILGLTLKNARYWQRYLLGTEPDIEHAVLRSVYQGPAVFNGMRICKLYVTPDAYKGWDYGKVMKTLEYLMRKTPGESDVVYLNEDHPTVQRRSGW